MLRPARIPVTAALTLALSSGVATTQALPAAGPQQEAKGWSAPAARDPGTKPGEQPDAVGQSRPALDYPIISNYALSAQSFHPKIGGARFYADSLERTFTGMGL